MITKLDETTFLNWLILVDQEITKFLLIQQEEMLYEKTLRATIPNIDYAP